MNFSQNKSVWIAITLFSPLLLLGVNYGIKVMTSVYKKDLGNGVVIYGDDYVKSGSWVFDCKYSRVISRERLLAPWVELTELKEIAVERMYYLNRSDVAPTKDAIKAITARPEWYKGLQYVYSGLGENSKLGLHKFFLLAEHAGRTWAVEVYQHPRSKGKSRFVVTGRRYEPETYVDYTKAFAAAVNSCPAPQ